MSFNQSLTSNQSVHTTFDEEDEVVVAEFDVYWCTKLQENTELIVQQSPLRDPMYPHHEDMDSNGFDKVAWKPHHKKMQVEAKIDRNHPTFYAYNGLENTIDKYTYESTLVPPPSTFAIGYVHTDSRTVILMPVHTVLQMRPSMQHLDAAAGDGSGAGGGGGEVKQEEDGELKQVKVKVLKRETDRQQAARKASWAWLRQQEDQEEWLQLPYKGYDSAQAQEAWKLVDDVPDGVKDHITMDGQRMLYFHAISPGMGVRELAEALAAGDSTAHDQHGEASSHAATKVPRNVVISEEAKRTFPDTLKTLFEAHKVCTLANIRNYLNRLPERPPAAEYVEAPDQQLHDAIKGCNQYVNIGAVYVEKSTGNENIDPMRDVVLNMLKNGPGSLKKSEVQSALMEQGIEFVETVYAKVMRSLCESKGGTWSLRKGADGL